jgi:outer membrane protein assembly factor BamB
MSNAKTFILFRFNDFVARQIRELLMKARFCAMHRLLVSCQTMSFVLVALLCPLIAASAHGQTILLGDQNVETSLDSNSAGSAEAFQTTASASGTVGTLTVYLDATSTATNVYLGLYADNGGHPGALLAQANSTAPVRGAWNIFPISPTAVTAGVRYWFAILGSGNGKPIFRDRVSGSCKSETNSQSGLSVLPLSWSTGTVYPDCPLSAYGVAVTSSSPVLSVTPLSLAFTAIPGGSDPAPATVNISNTGGGALNFSAATDTPAWLSVSPTTGSAPQALQISATGLGLGLGTYTGHVTVTASGASGSPATITVTLTVAKPADWLMVDHDQSRSGNAVDESTITTSNVGSLRMTWSVPLDGPVTAQPLFVGAAPIGSTSSDALIVATGGNSIYALSASTGTTLWKRNFGVQASNCAIPGGFGVSGAPLVDRGTGTIYTVSDNGQFHAILLGDGSDKFAPLNLISGPSTNKVWGGINKLGNSVYVTSASDGCDTPSWRGQIYQIDVSSTPRVLKTFVVVPGIAAPNGGGGIWGYGGIALDPSNGQVYAATGADSNVPEGYTPFADRAIALDANLNMLGSFGPPEPGTFPCTGEPCDLDFGATPVVFQPPSCPTMAAVGNKNGNLYLFKGTELAASLPPFQTLSINQDNDSLGSGGVGGVPAYWSSGNMLFVTDAGAGMNGVRAGVVGLNITPSCTLQVAWSNTLGGSGSPNSTPTVANGVVLVGEGLTGEVHGYDALTGTELWNSGNTAYSAAATYAAPIVAQGNVYVGSWGNFSGGGQVGAFSLSGIGPIVSVSPGTLSFNATQGGPNPSAASLSVTNTGGGILTFSAASDSAWLGVSPITGTAPQILQVMVNISGLAQGTYNGNIKITSSGASGSPTLISVSLVIGAPLPPVLTVSPATIPFTATQSGSNPSPATINVTNTGGGTLSFTATSDSPWLSVSPTAGNAPQSAQVAANISGLALGSYTGHLTITATGAQNSPSTVTVSLTVSGAGAVLLGDQSIESQRDTNNRGIAEAFQTTASLSGTLSSLSVYLDGASTAATVYVGVYSDNGGHPGTLLVQGSKSSPTAGTWNAIPLGSTPITSGKTYWIAILGTTAGTPYFRDRGRGPCKSETNKLANLTALPGTWATGAVYTDCPLSGYGQ